MQSPFGWPSEVVRLVLAGCFRAGAIFLERQTAAGLTPLYDYKEALDDFTKIKTFEKTTFRLAESSLTLEQIKQVSKELIALGVAGTPESGNALAGALRQLGSKLQEGVRDAQLRAEAGLPLGDDILKCDAALKNPTTLKDPTKAALAFLQVAPQWRALDEGLDALRAFLEANRHKEFETSRQLVSLVRNHPLPGDADDKTAVDQALADIDAIVEKKTVVPRWNDYRASVNKVHEVYSKASRGSYAALQKEVNETVAAIRSGTAYAAAPSPSGTVCWRSKFWPRWAMLLPGGGADYDRVTARRDNQDNPFLHRAGRQSAPCLPSRSGRRPPRVEGGPTQARAEDLHLERSSGPRWTPICQRS